MSATSSRTAILLLLAAGTGCGGSDPSDPIVPPPDLVLTTVEVTPDTATLFTLQPGNWVRLTATPKDQDGGVMSGLPDPTFSSDDEAVGTVDAEGIVTAAAPGTARVTASLTVDGITKAGSSEITVVEASAASEVTAPQFAFVPQVADVAAGGKVTWTVAGIHHTVAFTTSGAPADIPEMLFQSVSRTFSTPGTFQYRCTIHNAMRGTVRVH
jgi:plastocyanin